MQKRYLTWVALAFLLGILLAQQHSWVYALLLIGGSGVVIMQFLRVKKWRQAAGLAAALLLSALCGFFRFSQEMLKKEPYEAYLTQETSIELQGIIYKKETKNETNRIYLKQCHVKIEEHIFSTNRAVVYLDQLPYQIGNKVLVKGTSAGLQEPANEGGFDEKNYCESQMLDWKVYADSVEIVKKRTSWLPEQLYRLRQRIKTVYLEQMPEIEGGTLAAISLGEKGAMDQELKQKYQSNGISHILAISGLHISLVGMSVFQFLRKQNRTYLTSGTLALSAMYCFGELSGMNLSTQRAMIMFCFYIIAQMSGQAYDSLTALAGATLILWFQNPFLVTNTSFQFSFIAMLGAVVVYPLVYDGKKWKQSLFLCLSIQIMTLPLTLYYYYEIPVYVVFLNLCVLPLVGILLGSGLIGGLMGCFWGMGASICLKIPTYILRFYQGLLQVAEQLPGAVRITGKPKLWQVACYYIFLSLGLEWIRWKKNDVPQFWDVLHRQKEEEIWKRGILRVKNRCMLLFVGMAVLFCLLPKQNNFEMDVLDVGQGDGIFLKNEDGITFFIDGGSSSEKQVGTYRILPFLKYKGVKEVQYWFVSHTDADHISGLLEVLESGYPVKYLILAKNRGEGENDQKLLQTAKKAGCEIRYMRAGDAFTKGTTKIRCLFPDADVPSTDLNDRSLVLLIKDKTFSGLFSGDIPTESEAYLLMKQKIGPVLFYKAAHHGSKGSNSEDFLQALSPKITVASAGKENRYGHPAEEAVERIRASGSRFYCTIQSGQWKLYRGKNGKMCIWMRKRETAESE